MPTTKHMEIHAEDAKVNDLFTPPNKNGWFSITAVKSGPKNTTITWTDHRADSLPGGEIPTRNSHMPNDKLIGVQRSEATPEEVHLKKVDAHFQREEFYATQVMDKLFGLEAEREALKAEAEEKLRNNTVARFIDAYAANLAEAEAKLDWWTRFGMAVERHGADDRDEPSPYVGAWGVDVLRLLHDYVEKLVEEFMRSKADDGWSNDVFRNGLARLTHEVQRQMIGDYYANDLARYALHLVAEREELGL